MNYKVRYIVDLLIAQRAACRERHITSNEGGGLMQPGHTGGNVEGAVTPEGGEPVRMALGLLVEPAATIFAVADGTPVLKEFFPPLPVWSQGLGQGWKATTFHFNVWRHVPGQPGHIGDNRPHGLAVYARRFAVHTAPETSLDALGKGNVLIRAGAIQGISVDNANPGRGKSHGTRLEMAIGTAQRT